MIREIFNLDPKLKIFAYIFLLANKLQTTMDQSIDEITSKQWFLLAALSYFKEPPSLKELASSIGSSHQNIRQMVNKLEERGFVSTSRDSADKRTIRISLTKKVNEWQEKNEEMQVEFLKSFYSGISNEDLTIVSKSMEKLYDNLGGIKWRELKSY